MKVDGEGVDEGGEDERDDDAPGHEFAEMLDEGGEVKDAREVEDGGEDDGGVERSEGVAVVHQGLVIEGRYGKTWCAQGSAPTPNTYNPTPPPPHETHLPD